MTRTDRYKAWLHAFAVLLAASTFCLVCVGGLVTSKGAGMAVPDWPTTYGYNMFLFPISQWKGGILFEHSHRLVASLVGLLTVTLAIWLRERESRRWLRRVGYLAVVLVVAQGVLGGLRVTAMKDELGIFHAILAQLFLILVSSIALWTSRWWHARRESEGAANSDGLTTESIELKRTELRTFSRWAFSLALVILAQLAIGASMRHQHAGLSIPDFPAAYGKVWPATDADSVARYNQLRGEVNALNPITAAQIYLQMAHRGMALIILIAAVALVVMAARRFSGVSVVQWFARALLVLILLQVVLGAVTIWSNKAADIATAHVGVGALSLVVTALWTQVMRRMAGDVRVSSTVQVSSDREAVISGRAVEV